MDADFIITIVTGLSSSLHFDLMHVETVSEMAGETVLNIEPNIVIGAFSAGPHTVTLGTT